MLQSIRSPIVIGKSGATVFRVTREDGVQWIEKSGAASDVSVEAAVMKWCAGRRDNFGSEAERSLRKHVPHDCEDEALLRRFRLLDELF
jgi:hypothetical protein